MTQPIDMSFLIDALEDHSSMAACYLDKQTGEILRISEYDTEEEKKPFYDQIDAFPDRYVRIEPLDSSISFRIMEDFVQGLPEGEDRRILERALSWKKPFSNFRNALREMPEIGALWHKFHDARLTALAKKWIEDEGIK